MSLLFKRIKDWAVSITSFRTGDVIPVDGPSGTAKMPYSDLAKEVIKDSANNPAATEADLVAGSTLPIMTANGPKSLPGNTIAKASEQAALNTYAQNVAHSIAPEFDSTRTYKACESVTYTDGKVYTFTAPHYGAWTGTDVVEIPLATLITGLNSVAEKGISAINNNQHEIFSVSIFKNGTIDSNGVFSDSYTSRIATPDLQHTSRKLSLVIADGYALIYATYTNGGVKVTRTPGITGSLDIPADTYFRLAIYPATGEVLSNVASVFEYVQYVEFNSLLLNKLSEKIPAGKFGYFVVDGKDTNFIVHLDGTNFIDSWISGAYIKDGVETTTAQDLWATGKVFLKPSTTYYFNTLQKGYYAFYDKDDNVLDSHNNDNSLANPFTTPAGTCYARFTAPSAAYKNSAWISSENLTPAVYEEGFNVGKIGKFCDWNGGEFSIFKKCLCIGDSLTYGVFNHNEGGTTEYVSYPNTYSYPHFLEKISGTDCTNLGQASATIDEWWASHSSYDFSGYDCAVIMLGVNDYFRYGAWTSAAETALGNIITALKSANEGIKIFVSTIIPAMAFYNATYEAISAGIRNVVSSLSDPNVILLDLEIYGQTKKSQAYNNGHLSALGYHRLAKDVFNLTSFIIQCRQLEFRNVQFVCTEFYYE